MGFEKIKRPLKPAGGIDARLTGIDPDFQFDTLRQGVTTSTAASTGLGPRGNFAIVTTTTGAPVVYTLASPACSGGDRISIVVDQMESSSDAPIHINTGGGGAGATTEDMITLPVEGSGVSLVSLSTSRWLVDGANAATFSSST